MLVVLVRWYPRINFDAHQLVFTVNSVLHQDQNVAEDRINLSRKNHRWHAYKAEELPVSKVHNALNVYIVSQIAYHDLTVVTWKVFIGYNRVV